MAKAIWVTSTAISLPCQLSSDSASAEAITPRYSGISCCVWPASQTQAVHKDRAVKKRSPGPNFSSAQSLRSDMRHENDCIGKLRYLRLAHHDNRAGRVSAERPASCNHAGLKHPELLVTVFTGFLYLVNSDYQKILVQRLLFKTLHQPLRVGFQFACQLHEQLFLLPQLIPCHTFAAIIRLVKVLPRLARNLLQQ